jgi:hypothetical protein
MNRGLIGKIAYVFLPIVNITNNSLVKTGYYSICFDTTIELTLMKFFAVLVGLTAGFFLGIIWKDRLIDFFGKLSKA